MFIKNGNSHKIGDWVTTTMDHECLAGTMLKGSRVMVTDVGPRGYNIKDEEGNIVIEIGWTI